MLLLIPLLLLLQGAVLASDADKILDLTWVITGTTPMNMAAQMGGNNPFSPQPTRQSPYVHWVCHRRQPVPFDNDEHDIMMADKLSCCQQIYNVMTYNQELCWIKNGCGDGTDPASVAAAKKNKKKMNTKNSRSDFIRHCSNSITGVPKKPDGASYGPEIDDLDEEYEFQLPLVAQFSLVMAPDLMKYNTLGPWQQWISFDDDGRGAFHMDVNGPLQLAVDFGPTMSMIKKTKQKVKPTTTSKKTTTEEEEEEEDETTTEEEDEEEQEEETKQGEDIEEKEKEVTEGSEEKPEDEESETAVVDDEEIISPPVEIKKETTKTDFSAELRTWVEESPNDDDNERMLLFRLKMKHETLPDYLEENAAASTSSYIAKTNIIIFTTKGVRIEETVPKCEITSCGSKSSGEPFTCNLQWTDNDAVRIASAAATVKTKSSSSSSTPAPIVGITATIASSDVDDNNDYELLRQCNIQFRIPLRLEDDDYVIASPMVHHAQLKTTTTINTSTSGQEEITATTPTIWKWNGKTSYQRPMMTDIDELFTVPPKDEL